MILRPFMRAIPGELEDAAVVDGATRLVFFWRILLPLSKPALSTVAILSVRDELELLPAAAGRSPMTWRTSRCRSGSRPSSPSTRRTPRVILAFTALSMVPSLAFFVFAERRIVGGLTGAIKG